MGKFKDILNERFGRLVVVENYGSLNKKIHWGCICDCGNKTKVSGSNLKMGKINSCGCIKKEILLKRNEEMSTHNMKKTPLYSVWDGIKRRASLKRNDSKLHTRYKERGIFICKEWSDDFISFYNWAISNGYKKGLQVDRINNDGEYSPANCRFVTPFVNSMNKSTTLDSEKIEKAKVMYNNGMSIVEIAKEIDLKYSGLYQRLTGRRGVEKVTKTVKK